MGLKLIIFDLDGTLVDTAEDITNALNYAVKPLGVEPLGVRDTTALVGEGITRLIEKLLGSRYAALGAEVQGRFLEHYSEHLADRSSLYPNVRETLEGLGGLKKAVISNKRENLSRRLLEALDINRHFALVVGSDTVSERKPSAMPILHVLSALGAGAGESLMVGDSTYDIEAGKRAGLRTVAVTYGYRDRSVLRDADHMIEDMSELIPLLYERGYLEARRKEKRYIVPAGYRDMIDFRIQTPENLAAASLLNYSGRGVMIRLPVALEVGSLMEFIASVPGPLSKEVAFKARIRQCSEHGGQYLAGAEVEEVAGEGWLRVFTRLHAFMAEQARH
jgi:phosphoglycolate phosphatase